MISYAVTLLITSLHGSNVPSADSLDKALGLVPPSAKLVAVVPDLGRTNDDLGQMIDAMDRPGTVLAGRPIEMLKAQLGIGPGLNESGSLLMWMEMPGVAGAEPVAAFLVPTTDPGGFLKGNFSAAEDVGPDAWRTPEGEVLHARDVDGHVLLSSSESLVDGYAPGAGMAATVAGRLGAHARKLADEGDIVVWGDGAALGAVTNAAAQEQMVEVPGAENLQMLSSMTNGATDGMLVVNFDPLGLSIRTFARYEPDSTIGAFARGGASKGPPMNRLPGNPFYFAISADIAGMGGIGTFRKMMEFMGEPGEFMPEAFQTDDVEINQMQMAAYPSRLGIALGGLLNDSALVLTSSDPDALENLLRETVLSTEGETDGIRYAPEWVNDKELRTGGTANAFRIKETVLPPKSGSRGSRVGEVAFQRMILQLFYGSRGLSGFSGVEGDAFVMTFSQRPDVWQRALTSSGGGDSTIADSPVLKSMRSWLIADPDVEVLLGVGTFTKLLEQLARTLPIVQPDMIPDIPQGTPPVAFDMEVDKGTIEMAFVIPTGVIALGFDQVMEQMTRGFSGPGDDPGEDRGRPARDRGR